MQSLHSTPIEKENNILDRFSTKERFLYHYRVFFENEKHLISKYITNAVPQGSILNVGCGRNGTERRLFSTSDYKIFGVDINKDSIRILHEKRLYDGLYLGSIAALPFGSEQFDIIYLRGVLHHLIYPEYLLVEGLNECFRVLKPGGILALVEPNLFHPIGILLYMSHILRIDIHIHGTDDDVPLSPLSLHKELSRHGHSISTHAIDYSWRRLPVRLQMFINFLHRSIWNYSEKFPYCGHTLMMVSRKR